MERKARILLVEDEDDIRDLMTLHLKSEGHEVVAFDNGEEALAKAKSENFNLAILDWMLPGVSGIEICKRLRGQVPILMVTARSSSADLVLGLEMGADDYIVKPFEIPVFTARVRALLRRTKQALAQGSKNYSLGDLTIDAATFEVRSGKDEVKLTASEFKLLLALVENQGRVLSREMLISAIQGKGITVVGRTIDTHILALRKKLGSSGDCIETLRGIGYRIKA